jgi:NOL1/NOP2/sun family putative RNA methylase
MSYKPSPELQDLMDQLLGSEKEAFFASVGEQLPHTIRFNNLRGEISQLKGFMEEQGFHLEQFPGLEEIYRLTYQPYPIGKSLSHFLGHFYVQDIASMLPPVVLQPQAGDIILDVSAAPGSKTTQMAVMMENRGMILANDIVQKRLRALINNLQRLGIVNTAVVKNYGESFGNQYFETFDKILLDPACSGLGTLHKSPEVLSWWTPNHCTRLASGQRALISSAIKALKPGGTLVYSTCTLTVEENEEIVDHALNEFPVALERFDLLGLTSRPGITEFKGKSYHPSLAQAKRLYPFENQTEGFFVARLRKTGSMEKKSFRKEKPALNFNFIPDSKSPVKKYLDMLSQHFDINRKLFSDYRYYIDKNITAVTPEIANFPFKSKPIKSGLTIAHTLTQAAKLTTEGAQLFGTAAGKNVLDLPDLPTLENFVNRKDINMQTDANFQVMIKHRELIIGYGLAENGKFKSQFPKAEWPFRLVQTTPPGA